MPSLSEPRTPSHFKSFFRQCLNFWNRLPSVPRDIFTTVVFLLIAYSASDMLLGHTGAENNTALVFVLAVMFISLMTDGYSYGIIASLIGGFCTNFYFMYPYASFSLSYTGYPVAMVSMLIVSMIVCTLTSKVKLMAVDAGRREQKTIALYEQNQRLNNENTAIQIEAARETIRSNILRSVSHDLRTPLTAISGAATVLQASSEMLSEKNQSLLEDIRTDADTLITMVENLLSITRIQDSTAPLIKREEMLEEVAGDAVMTVRRRFPETQVNLVISEDILFLPMEPMLIKQVMVNLLENAIRHSGAAERLSLHLFRRQEWAVTEVRDFGCGLSADVLKSIRSGQQLPQDLSGDSSRGMGIGLSVCQSIVKAHNGFFSAENAPDGGAVFQFGLPMEES